jgi:hypothetical protein
MAGMKFIVYRTTADRTRRENGRLAEGVAVSGAPPSGDWVFVQDERKFYRVFGTQSHQIDGHGQFLRSAIETESR